MKPSRLITLADSNDDNGTDPNDIEPNIEHKIEPRAVKLKDAQLYAMELVSCWTIPKRLRLKRCY